MFGPLLSRPGQLPHRRLLLSQWHRLLWLLSPGGAMLRLRVGILDLRIQPSRIQPVQAFRQPMLVMGRRGSVKVFFKPPRKQTQMKLLFLRFKRMPRCIQRECPNRQQTYQLSQALVSKARSTVCTLLQYSDETETAVNPAFQSCQLTSSR